MSSGERGWQRSKCGQEAVEDESLDFFAAGHPLVEGILAELEVLTQPAAGMPGSGG